MANERVEFDIVVDGKKAITSLNDVKKATADLEKSTMDLEKQNDKLRKSISQLDKTDANYKRNKAQLTSELKKNTSRLKENSASLKKLRAASQDAGTEVARTKSILSSGWVKIGATIAAVGVTMKKAFDLAKDIDTLETKLTVASGSSELMRDKMDELNQVADKMGVSFEVIAESYSKFKIASDLAGTGAADTEKIFQAVITASSAMKLSADETHGAFKALEQMMSKGTVQSEELKGQLGERLPGAFSLAARAMGVTTMQLQKMLENGEVLASDLLPKLADQLQNKFAKGAVEASNSIQASYNRLGNVFTDVKGIINASLEEMGIIDFFSKAVKTVKEYTSELLRASRAVEDLSSTERQEEIIEVTTRLKQLQKDLANDSGFFAKAREMDNVKELKELTLRLQKLREVDAEQKKAIKTAKDRADAEVKVTQAANERSVVNEAEKAFIKDYIESVAEKHELELIQLDKEFEAHSKHVQDKALLAEWYANRVKQIMSKAADDGMLDLEFAENEALFEELEEDLEAHEAEMQSIRDNWGDTYRQSILSDQEYELDLLQREYDKKKEAKINELELEAWFQKEKQAIIDKGDLNLQAAAEMNEVIFDDMADAMTQFITTGKLNMREFALSIIEQLVRIQVVSAMTSIFGGGGGGAGGIIGTVGSAIGGLFHTGGEVKHTGGAIGGGASMPSYHTGGMRTDERVAKLQVGEAVINRAGAKNNADAINAMNKGMKVGGGDNITTAEINFNVTAIDSQSFNEYLITNRNTIEGIINRSLSTNGSVRQTIKTVI